MGLRYTPMSTLLMQDGTEQTYDVTQHGKPQPKPVTPDANYGHLEHVSKCLVPTINFVGPAIDYIADHKYVQVSSI